LPVVYPRLAPWALICRPLRGLTAARKVSDIGRPAGNARATTRPVGDAGEPPALQRPGVFMLSGRVRALRALCGENPSPYSIVKERSRRPRAAPDSYRHLLKQVESRRTSPTCPKLPASIPYFIMTYVSSPGALFQHPAVENKPNIVRTANRVAQDAASAIRVRQHTWGRAAGAWRAGHGDTPDTRDTKWTPATLRIHGTPGRGHRGMLASR